MAALNPNLGQLDPNGPNQGVVIGLDEDAPFRAALGQIKALLDTLGVEGTVAMGATGTHSPARVHRRWRPDAGVLCQT